MKHESSDRLLSDIHHAIKVAARFRKPEPERRFHRHDEYVSYHLYVAAMEKTWKEFRPQILRLSLQHRCDLASNLLAQHIGELGHIGISVLALSAQELNPAHFDYLSRLLDHFRSWSHVDHFCSDVVRVLLANHPRDTIALLEDWNHSPVRWKRRASVVSFTRKVGESGVFTDEVLRLCDNLIWDPEDIVQKGVGWALKDNLRSAPGRILSYIKELRRKGVPSTITLYAIRDLKGVKRQEVLSIKKASETPKKGTAKSRRDRR